MYDDDLGCGCILSLLGIGIVIAVVALVVYLATILSAVLAGVGTFYGGYIGIRNYALSFKKNIIDSNKR